MLRVFGIVPHQMGQYEEIEKIGEGSFGKVYKCRNSDTGDIVAIKTIFFHEYGGVPSSVIREIALLKEMDHPNIVKLLEVLSTDNKVSLVFEYVEKDLNVFLRINPSINQDPEVIKMFMHNILSGLLYCHSEKIIHRDLKTDNMLINSHDRVVKLADFGLARATDIPLISLTPKVGNMSHSAPEVLLGSPQYSSPSDIWSVGCIFARIVMRKSLFVKRGLPKDLLNQISSVIGTPDEQTWPGVTTLFPVVNTLQKYPPQNLAQIVQGLEPAGIDLLSKMLRWNPSDRITAREALNHEYFRDTEGLI